jgi:hypothetical protein
MFISILALGVAVDQGIEARTHDKLTARPALNFIRRAATADNISGLYIKNSGFGPGKIDGFRVYLDGQEVHPEEHTATWQVVTNKNKDLFKDVEKQPPTWAWPDDGDVMKSGEEMELYITPTSNITDLNAFSKLIGYRIVIRLHVCSVYDECEDLCSGSNCAGKAMRPT